MVKNKVKRGRKQRNIMTVSFNCQKTVKQTYKVSCCGWSGVVSLNFPKSTHETLDSFAVRTKLENFGKNKQHGIVRTKIVEAKH
jgi:hypothetical protein